MLANRPKSFIGWCLLGILLCTMAGTALIAYQKTNGCYNNRPPLRSIHMTIDVSQSQQLIGQSKKFADKYGFKIQIAYYTPNGTDFSIWMERKDVEVITRSPFKLGEFRIGFYNNNCVHPTVASDIEGLVTDLKNRISEIPSAKITEVK
jgi:hypothetical protein